MGEPLPHEGATSNRYVVLGKLATGGMADLFLARSTNEAGLERYVVLKRVLAERSRDPDFVRMFLDEARLAAQLQHPNIAQVHDIGKLGGSYFFTMEYVHGEDMRAVLYRAHLQKRPLPINHVLHIACGALAALHHAHERAGHDDKPLGIVHRDVSPSNVMVSYEGVVKLVDFGVAKAAQRSSETRTGTIKGKIGYLSPEQCQGAAIDRRSDVFSLGIVLYEMLTGKRLFKRENDFGVMMSIVQDEVPPPSSLRPEVSKELDAIVARALAKQPAARFATAADMLEAIELVAAQERHALSATAVGRFLRELFGERKPPWVELTTRSDEPRSVTVTSEAMPSVSSDILSYDIQIDADLERAPPLRRHEHEISASPSAVPILPRGAVSEIVTSVQPPSAALEPSVASSRSPESSPPSQRARAIRIVVVAALASAIAITGFVVATRSSTDSRAADPSPPEPKPEPIVAQSEVQPEQRPEVQPEVQPAVRPEVQPEVNPEATPEAKPDTKPGVNPAAKPDVKPAPSIEELCATKPLKLAAADRTRCALAACERKDKKAALAFHAASTRAVRTAIERGCKADGVVLVQPPVKRPRSSPAPDPCEANPLRCQK